MLELPICRQGRGNKTAVSGCHSRPATIALMSALPGLGQNQSDRPPLIAFRDIKRGRVTAARSDTVFERRMPVHQVLNNQLNTEMLQVCVRGVVPCVIADREIEGVIGWLDVVVVVDQAGEDWDTCCSPRAHRAASHQALGIDVWWGVLRVEEMRLVIHKTGNRPRTIGPAETRPVTQSRQGFDPVL